MAIAAESGTFQLRGRWTFASGNVVAHAGPPQYFTFTSAAGVANTGGLTGAFLEDADLESISGPTPPWSPTTLAGAPPGFTPTTNLKIHILWSLPGADASNREGDGLTAGVSWDLGFFSSWPTKDYLTPLPDHTPLFDMLGLAEMTISEVTGAGADTMTINADHVRIQGDYILQVYWWTIPAVDACGERHTPRYQLAAEQPDPVDGVPWQRLDPEDEDAAPPLAITLLEPSHGPLEGGTALTIRGEGFGVDATVTVGGTAAEDVVIVSALQITCTTPAHAVGLADVIVTNADGGTTS